MERPPALRPATPKDVSQMVKVLVAAQVDAEPGRGRTRSDRSIAYDLERRVLPEADVWVAERDDVVVGFVAVRGAVLTHLHVEPPAEGRGVGRALLGRALERGAVGLKATVPAADARTTAFLGARGFVWDGDVERDGRPHIELRGPGPDTSWW